MTHVFTICVDETVATVEMLYMFLFLAPSAWLQNFTESCGSRCSRRFISDSRLIDDSYRVAPKRVFLELIKNYRTVRLDWRENEPPNSQTADTKQVHVDIVEAIFKVVTFREKCDSMAANGASNEQVMAAADNAADTLNCFPKTCNLLDR